MLRIFCKSDQIQFFFIVCHHLKDPWFLEGDKSFIIVNYFSGSSRDTVENQVPMLYSALCHGGGVCKDRNPTVGLRAESWNGMERALIQEECKHHRKDTS